MTQKGKGIFLGKPVATPTGLMIGRPGLLIFAKGGQSSINELVLDFGASSTITFDFGSTSSLSIVFENP